MTFLSSTRRRPNSPAATKQSPAPVKAPAKTPPSACELKAKAAPPPEPPPAPERAPRKLWRDVNKPHLPSIDTLLWSVMLLAPVALALAPLSGLALGATLASAGFCALAVVLVVGLCGAALVIRSRHEAAHSRAETLAARNLHDDLTQTRKTQ